MTLAPIEREAIVLQVIVETIHAMVNYEMLNFSSGHEQIQVTPKSTSQCAMFNVLLADMLEPVDPELLGVKGNLLEALVAVAQSPQLGKGDAARRLQATTKVLTDWLEQEIEVCVWFPSIDAEFPQLRLRRRDFVSICGNISKHNVSRLTRNAKRLAKLLSKDGVTVQWVDALVALDDFQQRFHDDILVYHTTTIAELLNNLRWAIHEYLVAEFERAYIPPSAEEDPRYSFKYPPGLESPYAKLRYWDVMNSVRAQPQVPRFTGNPNLKGDY